MTAMNKVEHDLAGPCVENRRAMAPQRSETSMAADPAHPSTLDRATRDRFTVTLRIKPDRRRAVTRIDPARERRAR
jgi:hypothetical protein